MRILHVNSFYVTGPFYKNLFDRQVALGDVPRVYLPMADTDDDGGRDYGAYTDVARPYRKFDRFLYHYKNNKLLRDATARYADFPCEVIHAHSLFSNGFVARGLAKARHVPYIVAVRDGDVNIYFKKMPHLRGEGRRILKEAARVVFLSESYRDKALLPYLPKAELEAVWRKSVVIPNGIDDFWLQNIAPPKIRMNRPLRVLLVGQIIPRKNIEAAARAVARCNQEGEEAALKVVGKPVDQALVEKIRDLPYTTLMPPRPMERLLPLYRSCDMFLLPSWRETFGLVYAEAMSQGLPVLYTRDQGFDGQFPDGDVGYAVDPNDPADIAARIFDVCDHHAALSKNAVERAPRFDWDVIAKAYQTLYQAII